MNMALRNRLQPFGPSLLFKIRGSLSLGDLWGPYSSDFYQWSFLQVTDAARCCHFLGLRPGGLWASSTVEEVWRWLFRAWGLVGPWYSRRQTVFWVLIGNEAGLTSVKSGMKKTLMLMLTFWENEIVSEGNQNMLPWHKNYLQLKAIFCLKAGIKLFHWRQILISPEKVLEDSEDQSC